MVIRSHKYQLMEGTVPEQTTRPASALQSAVPLVPVLVEFPKRSFGSDSDVLHLLGQRSMFAHQKRLLDVFQKPTVCESNRV